MQQHTTAVVPVDPEDTRLTTSLRPDPTSPARQTISPTHRERDVLEHAPTGELLDPQHGATDSGNRLGEELGELAPDDLLDDLPGGRPEIGASATVAPSRITV